MTQDELEGWICRVAREHGCAAVALREMARAVGVPYLDLDPARQPADIGKRLGLTAIYDGLPRNFAYIAPGHDYGVREWDGGHGIQTLHVASANVGIVVPGIGRFVPVKVDRYGDGPWDWVDDRSILA